MVVVAFSSDILKVTVIPAKVRKDILLHCICIQYSKKYPRLVMCLQVFEVLDRVFALRGLVCAIAREVVELVVALHTE